MPCEVKVLPEIGIVLVAYSDEVGLDELMQVREAQEASPDFRPEFNQLVCFLPDANVTVTGDEMRAFSMLAPMYAPSSRRAIWAPESIAFGLSRMFGSLKLDDAGDIVVFATLAEACGFLELELDRVRGLVAGFDGGFS